MAKGDTGMRGINTLELNAERQDQLHEMLISERKKPLGEDYHLDHIMPLVRGGANTDDNMQLLTQKCNSQKHAKDPIDFMQSRGFLL